MAKTSERSQGNRTRGKDRPGRRTPTRSAAPPASKRYTPPVPREVKRSPRWFPWMLLSLFIIGILLIIGNYASFLPSSPSNWYTLSGLVLILAGALAATYYR